MTWLSSGSKAFTATKQRLEAGLKQANEEKTRHMMEAERAKQELTQRQRQVDLLQQVRGCSITQLVSVARLSARLSARLAGQGQVKVISSAILDS